MKFYVERAREIAPGEEERETLGEFDTDQEANDEVNRLEEAGEVGKGTEWVAIVRRENA